MNKPTTALPRSRQPGSKQGGHPRVGSLFELPCTCGQAAWVLLRSLSPNDEGRRRAYGCAHCGARIDTLEMPAYPLIYGEPLLSRRVHTPDTPCPGCGAVNVQRQIYRSFDALLAHATTCNVCRRSWQSAEVLIAGPRPALSRGARRRVRQQVTAQPDPTPADPLAYLDATQAVPPLQLSDVALADLRRFAATYAQASALLTAARAARQQLAGPLPTVCPFGRPEVLDAYRRSAHNSWPRCLPVTPSGHFWPAFYTFVTHELFLTALERLRREQEGDFVTLAYLRVYRSDAPGGYEYLHSDAEALATALDHLGVLMWALLREAAGLSEPRAEYTGGAQ